MTFKKHDSSKFDIKHSLQYDAGNFRSHIRNVFISDTFSSGHQIASKTFTVMATIDHIRNIVSSQFQMLSFGNDDDESMFFADAILLSVKTVDSLMECNVIGDEKLVHELYTNIMENVGGYSSHIRWVYDPHYMDSMNIIVPNKNLPFSEMYPFLNGEDLSSYYDRFIDSEANILLLIGPPGTGKTSFLRGLLHHTKQNAFLTYDMNMLEKDQFFAMWFASTKENIVIIEDADNLLLPREDGNDLMSRFLNLGDGLLSFKGKKMIFTTNLPSTTSIDPALLRPGRCHDVVSFRKLTREESKVVANKCHLPFDKEGNEFSIGEIFAENQPQKPKSNFGFI